MSTEAGLPARPGLAGRQRLLVVADFASLIAAITLAGTAIVVGKSRENGLHPVIAEAAPLNGLWQRHAGPGTIPAVALAILAFLFAPWLARRLPWRTLLVASAATSLAWTASLAWIDGWHRGFSDRLEARDQYLVDVDRVHNVHAFLRGFAQHISAQDQHPWVTHVAGHPPGALLVFVGLKDVGLGGGLWAGLVCVVAAAVGIAAVMVTVALCINQEAARRLCPFLVFWPAAIFAGVSADAFFLGVSAVGVALLAVGCTQTGLLRIILLAASGLVLGASLYLSYGLVLLAPVVLVVLIKLARPRDVATVAGGFAVVVVAFSLSGFLWWQGYRALHTRYYDGVAAARSYHYWVWANFAALLFALGPVIVPALVRVFTRGASDGAESRGTRSSWSIAPLPMAALAGVTMATLSGLSKSEVERIWLPFMPWLLIACLALPVRSTRAWLGLQLAFAVGLQSALLSPW